MTTRTRYFVIAALTVLAVGLGSGLVAYYVGLPALLAGPTDELRLLPKNATVVAFADVQALMTSELHQRLAQVLPGDIGRRNDFKERTGIDVETDVQQITGCLAPSSESDDPRSRAGLMLVRGVFDEARIEGVMRDRGARVEDYKGSRLLTADDTSAAVPGQPGSGGGGLGRFRGTVRRDVALTFIEPGLAAIGSPELVRRAVDLKAGEGESVADDEEMRSRMSPLESSTLWMAGHFNALERGANLPPAVSQFSQQLAAIQWFSISATVNADVEGVLHAEARDETGAGELRDVLRGVLAFGRLRAGSNPELDALMNSFQLSGVGNAVEFTFRMPFGVLDQLLPAPTVPVPDRR